MTTTTAFARILGDIDDGAVTLHADGRMTIPSDVTDADSYRDTVRDLIAYEYAAHRPATGDVSLTGAGMTALTVEGVAL